MSDQVYVYGKRNGSKGLRESVPIFWCVQEKKKACVWMCGSRKYMPMVYVFCVGDKSLEVKTYFG